MAFDKLTQTQQKTILQCMKLILEENYIEDWEFQTRLGINRNDMRRVIAEWPHLQDESDQTTMLAINESLNEVLHGVYVSDAVWAKWLDLPREEVKRTFELWRTLRGL